MRNLRIWQDTYSKAEWFYFCGIRFFQPARKPVFLTLLVIRCILPKAFRVTERGAKVLLFLRCVVRNVFALLFPALYGSFALLLAMIFSDVRLGRAVLIFTFTYVVTAAGSWQVDARETFKTYKRVIAVLEKYGSESKQFRDIKPHAYCTAVGYKMAVRDFHRKASRRVRKNYPPFAFAFFVYLYIIIKLWI